MKRVATIFLSAMLLAIVAGACNRELCPAYTDAGISEAVEVTL